MISGCPITNGRLCGTEMVFNAQFFNHFLIAAKTSGNCTLFTSMPLPFKKPIKKSFKKIIIVKITFSAKTSLLRGTTAIRGGADVFVFLSHEILGKFRALLFQKKGNRTRQIKQERRTNEAVRPFEPRRGSTLVEWPHLFCGEYQYKRLVRLPCALLLF